MAPGPLLLLSLQHSVPLLLSGRSRAEPRERGSSRAQHPRPCSPAASAHTQILLCPSHASKASWHGETSTRPSPGFPGETGLVMPSYLSTEID